MKKRSQFRIALFAVLMAAVLVASTIFVSNALAAYKPIIRLSVVNTSQFDFVFHIYGKNYGKEYSITLPPYSDGKLFIKPDEYAYFMETCNYTKYGDIELWTFQTLHNPVCGGKAAGYSNKSHHIDVSKIVKPVRVKIRNKTGQMVEVYLRTIDDHHFLTLEAGEHLQVILRKEEGIEYVYSYVACGGQLISGYFTPVVTPPLDLKCP